MQRMISPSWKERFFSMNLDFAGKNCRTGADSASALHQKSICCLYSSEGNRYSGGTTMREKLQLIMKHLRQGSLQKMWKQTIWIYQYGRRYWKSMILYTLLGVMGSCVSLASSLISKDLVDIITGHQTGRLLSTFAAMIGFAIEIFWSHRHPVMLRPLSVLRLTPRSRTNIFAKMLVTDWESLTEYHTGDLVTRWSSDASNISNGILNWVPNLIIYTFRFISALAVVLYYDPTFWPCLHFSVSRSVL